MIIEVWQINMGEEELDLFIKIMIQIKKMLKIIKYISVKLLVLHLVIKDLIDKEKMIN